MKICGRFSQSTSSLCKANVGSKGRIKKERKKNKKIKCNRNAGA
jgi:hypothetical protein